MKRMNENTLRNVIKKNVRNVLNEITWQDKDNIDRFYKDNGIEYYDDFDLSRFLNTIDELKDEIRGFSTRISSEHEVGDSTQAMKAIRCLEFVEKYLNRKFKQKDNFRNLFDEKFRNTHNGFSEEEYDDNLTDKRNRNYDAYSNGKEQEPFTDDEREYMDYKYRPR